ncbi:MAG: hypothetical protein OEY56_08400 [Cyclobacteriaceae bacterium]|nr:hypothetical protein [Cyclobacteriaceae bacterium]
MGFASTFAIGVSNQAEVAELMCSQLGFYVESTDENSLVLNNGALSVRLSKPSDFLPSVLCIDYSVETLDQGRKEMEACGFTASSEVQRPSLFRHELPMVGPFGIRLVLFQTFNEDELGLDTDLKTTLDWSPEAVQLAQQLLKEVAIDFREMARKKTIEDAEAMAVATGTMQVDLLRTVEAFIRTTPAFKQPSLIENLEKHGIKRQWIEDSIKKNERS